MEGRPVRYFNGYETDCNNKIIGCLARLGLDVSLPQELMMVADRTGAAAADVQDNSDVEIKENLRWAFRIYDSDSSGALSVSWSVVYRRKSS